MITKLSAQSFCTSIGSQFQWLKCRLSKNKVTKEDIWRVMWEAEAKPNRNIFTQSPCLNADSHQLFTSLLDQSKMIKCKEGRTVLYHRHAFRMRRSAQVIMSLDAKGREVGKCMTKWVNVGSSSDCSCLHFRACLTDLLLFACCSLCAARTCLQMSSFLTGMNIVASRK